MSNSTHPGRNPPTSLPQLLPRAEQSHKGDYGRVLVIGGSRGMAGAIALSGMAALRSGAGLVKLAVPSCILETVASYEPCLMTVPLPHDEQGRLNGDAIDAIADNVRWANVVAIGPGLGRSDELTKLVRTLWETVTVPMVADADALYALSQLKNIPPPAGPRIITPHGGEFARLQPNVDAANIESTQQAASAWAVAHKSTVVVKGPHTYVTDGQRRYFNQTGNPGMATGGMGDILTGVIAALLGQKLLPFDAACLGVYIQGLAGDFGAKELGQVSLIASDLLRFLPLAFQHHSVSSSYTNKS